MISCLVLTSALGLNLTLIRVLILTVHGTVIFTVHYIVYLLSESENVESSTDETKLDAGITKDTEKESIEMAYHWSQTVEDVTVRFELLDGSKKSDCSCEIKPEFLSVTLMNGQTLLQGQLFAKVDPEASTWTITESK